METRLQFLEQLPVSVQYQEEGMAAVLTSSESDLEIRVYDCPEDDFTPYIVCYATQHAHLCDEEDVLEMVEDVISGRLCAIEFFKGEARCLGGDIEAEYLDHLSLDTLKEAFSPLNVGRLLKKADTFQIRGWKKDQNLDGTIEDDGTIRVKRV